ncbi:TlpA disulfide reductase family protein [Patulibacter sp. SYSU D01012]|uniref:TlpA family protein disulfide reductase n=1 Tax=Patulibacter sp. SYSU D01012 TaxID=2817381 RepID=UPI001B313AA7|nr:TlpA disulfide reductase family protein [Patulibacter sp. SYSU D01012]
MDVPRSPRRRVAVGVIAVLVLAALGVGIAQGGNEVRSPDAVPSLAQAREDVADAPPALARVYSRAATVLGLDRAGYDRYVRALRGHPVVINAWYADCAPCREEFPILRRAAAEHGDRIAFLGINTADDRAKAQAFVDGQPTIYPHVLDRGAAIARGYGAGSVSPSTVILDARGEVAAVHAGVYASLDELERDLRRYAGAAATPQATTSQEDRAR